LGAATHHTAGNTANIRKAGLVGGKVTKVHPGGFSAEVIWDNGRKGVYHQSVLFTGIDVPPPPDAPPERRRDSERSRGNKARKSPTE
jgi:hypothetical protein